MARKDYIPQEESALAQWANNLATEANESENANAMGWGSLAGNVSNAATAISTAVQAKEAARQEYLSAVAAQDATITASIAIIRPMVASGKKQPTATESIQQALGVWGPEINFDPQTYKAELRAANLHLRKQGATTWTLAATMVRSPFLYHVNLTTPGTPECYDTRVRGVVGNDKGGLFSDTVTVLLM